MPDPYRHLQGVYDYYLQGSRTQETNPPVHLKQHLQGVLMHGRQLRIYGSFSNVYDNANICMHMAAQLGGAIPKRKTPSDTVLPD